MYLFNCFCLAFACVYTDAMAYRGDLIGCTIKFEGITNGQVPVVFTLNGRRITQDEIWIDYTPGEKPNDSFLSVFSKAAFLSLNFFL